MELIIIATLTTIALMSMQAVEFLKSRRPRVWTPVQATEVAPAVPAQPRTLHVEESSLEQAA
jgi:hypothetical protein